MHVNARRLVSVACALLLVVGAVGVATPAQASTTLVSCTDFSGELNASPPFTTIPSILSLTGSGTAATCTGSGITSATAVLSGTLIAGTCLPVANTIAGTLNAGTLDVTWNGGSGPPTTNFAWTVPAALQVGPSTSVILIVGYSQAGRFHNVVTPAVIQFVVTLSNPTPPCTLLGPGPTHVDLSGGSANVLDLA